uniref:Uncharacterized protein n=1 Tax=Magnetospirillum gryphiswaldense TaxID=55518 RepID=A4TYR2_9PROT|nr:hypothetical protein MGR_2346 [Magnetospirillum gryphiswaldense MSR-1]
MTHMKFAGDFRLPSACSERAFDANNVALIQPGISHRGTAEACSMLILMCLVLAMSDPA